MQMVAVESKEVDIVDIITCGTMTADHSRNRVVNEFLKSNAEWLFWIDSDTQVPGGAIGRMLAHGRTLVSGLYYGKNPPHPPIAYVRYNGAFTPIDKVTKWEKGQILKVDAAGMGCALTHRSVFEDIQANFQVLQIDGGGIVLAHNNDILGDIQTTNGAKKHEHDGKVYQGQWRVRLTKPTLESLAFPFFMIDYLRTEDMFFFDNAKRVGHDLYLDTSVECTHLRNVGFSGADYRDINGH